MGVSCTGKSTLIEKFKNNKQIKIDRILDKINQSGFDSLTSEEKNTLNEASKD